ncbi:hypothetical protein BDU57DRAFT_545963 [Ampelomyces quisqualis]|uniref:Uncharacterized protein n=1 Tax=Ampelomyces quisqualis TaxID=50730 RepID=A0A6A5QUX0_AMPQU|nr:hypothetical protein BDU57DRAFT_545963 [Ampelomyces quisqualis]
MSRHFKQMVSKPFKMVDAQLSAWGECKKKQQLDRMALAQEFRPLQHSSRSACQEEAGNIGNKNHVLELPVDLAGKIYPHDNSMYRKSRGVQMDSIPNSCNSESAKKLNSPQICQILGQHTIPTRHQTTSSHGYCMVTSDDSLASTSESMAVLFSNPTSGAQERNLYTTRQPPHEPQGAILEWLYFVEQDLGHDALASKDLHSAPPIPPAFSARVAAAVSPPGVLVRPCPATHKPTNSSSNVSATPKNAKAAPELQRHKSAFKGNRFSAEMSETRRKRCVTFQEPLTQVRTFSREDEQQDVGASEEYDGTWKTE